MGILVLFCHETSDFALYVLRCTRATGNKFFTVCAAVFCIFLWVYCRLFVLPCIIIKSILYPIFFDEFAWIRIPASLALTCLVILHVFWLMKLIQALLKVFQSGTLKDPTRKTQ